MSKKQPQWSMDRAFNMDDSNKQKVIDTLSTLYKIKKGNVNYDVAINELLSSGLINSKERYERSTQTLYKKFGLITDRETISDVGIELVEGRIEFHEMLLLQLFKIEYDYNNDRSNVVRPLVVVIKVMLKLKEKSSDNLWLDSYDYFNHLTEVQAYNQIDNCVNNILQDRVNNVNRYVDEIKDSDVWINCLVTTKLFKKVLNETNNRFTINHNELDLMGVISLNHEKSPFIGDYTSNEFTNPYVGLVNVIKNENIIDQNFYKVKGFSSDIVKTVINNKLINGLTQRSNDIAVFCTDEQSAEKMKGFISQYILQAANISDTKAGGIFSYLKNYANLLVYSYPKIYNMCDDTCYINLNGENSLQDTLSSEYNENEYTMDITGNGSNLIIYGTPGCGKSWYLNEKLKEDNYNHVIRTTFFQDYSNTDFVGQILPTIGEDIVEYVFNPGPFSLALYKAITNPSEKVALVIEELNRGNAASIFGDLFQLLDRGEDGISQYSITNINIQKWLNKEISSNFIEMKIPGNLSIYSTMNTSDQNVFTLDSAFKRRWKYEKLQNVFNDHPYATAEIPELETTWKKLVENINNTILTSDEFLNSEDKQLGIYFIDEKGVKNLTVNEYKEQARKEFAHKLFGYLWDDVAKFNRQEWFGEVKSLDELINNYLSGKGTEVFKNGIFNKNK